MSSGEHTTYFLMLQEAVLGLGRAAAYPTRRESCRMPGGAEAVFFLAPRHRWAKILYIYIMCIYIHIYTHIYKYSIHIYIYNIDGVYICRVTPQNLATLFPAALKLVQLTSDVDPEVSMLGDPGLDAWGSRFPSVPRGPIWSWQAGKSSINGRVNGRLMVG